MLAFVQFSDTITLGSILLALIIAMPGVYGYVKGVRYKTLYFIEKDTVKTLEEGREAFRLRAERLEGEVATLRESNRVLELSRSLEPVLGALLEGFKEVETSLARHDEESSKRSLAHLAVLKQIADRLGPEPDGD